MTKVLLIACITLNCLILGNSQGESEVNRYVQLIQEGIKKYKLTKGPEDASAYIPNSQKVTKFGIFDYIVVGAGAAGAVVANRLSANPSNKVLLIEAGGHENEFGSIPALSSYLFHSEYTWNFKTVPQKNLCLGMVNQQCTYPRGRGLGGGTIIGTPKYIRGSRSDYNNWAIQGNAGWSYRDVWPLFLKFENASFDFGNSPYHRRGGELNVEYSYPNKVPLYSFIQANIEQGHPLIDYNAESRHGVGSLQLNTLQGRTVSSSRAFLWPVFKRKNLKIMPYSYATKIHVHETNKTAHGVTFSHNKTLYLARTKQEIILSAGSLHTPQLLMISGIGPENHLKCFNIPLVKNLSVGYNLQDHSGMMGLFFKINITYPNYNLEEQVRQFLQGYGDLTFATYSEGMSWFNTKFESDPYNPDMEILLTVFDVSTEDFKRAYNIDNETFDAVFANIDPTNTFSMFAMQLSPKSRGKIKLESANPYKFPIVDLGIFTDPGGIDLARAYEGIKIILNLVDTKAFKQLNATLIDTTHPKCKQHVYLSRKYWYCQLKHVSFPGYHGSGTCKMGPVYDSMAVVNHKLQVHGIKKLRVADASIIPTITRGHMGETAMMIGEKVSQLILYD